MRVADIIAYVGKDRQDAIRAGLLSEQDFEDGMGGGYNAWALSAFVVDIVEHSLHAGKIVMSEAGFSEMRRAKRENYEKIYGAAEVNGDFSSDVAELFEELYCHEYEALEAGDESAAIFAHHILPTERRLSFYGKRYAWQEDLDQTVVDFISAMTDDYFYCQRVRSFFQLRHRSSHIGATLSRVCTHNIVLVCFEFVLLAVSIWKRSLSIVRMDTLFT